MSRPDAVPAPGGIDLRAEPEASGRLGIWFFLSGEIILFGGLIGAFLLYRFAHPEWREAAAHTSVLIGTVNTLVLLTSSYTMVMAFKASESGAKPARIWLFLTVLLGLVFLGVKAFEWGDKFSHHLTPGAGRFWSFYFTMTGLHALHLLGGVVVNSVFLVQALRDGTARLARRVEAGGLYWHFVDVVWIFLFPLFYLA